VNIVSLQFASGRNPGLLFSPTAENYAAVGLFYFNQSRIYFQP